MNCKTLLFIAIFALAITFSSRAQTLPSYLPTTGLTGYWSFTGNANDNTTNNNNGIVSGASLTSDRNGNMNSAYSFNGTTDQITFTQKFQFHKSGDATLSIWIKPNTQSVLPQGTFLYTSLNPDDSNRFNLYVYHTPAVQTRYDYREPDGTWRPLITDVTVTKDTWTHIVFIRSGNVYTVYRNGQYQQSFTDISPQLPYDSTGWMIGQDPTRPHDFTGQIDDIGIWARALTQSEITDFYSASTGVQNINNPNSLTIYPNPATEMITIDHALAQPMNMQLYNMMGQVVDQYTLSSGKNEIDVSLLPKGIYFIRMSSADREFQKKILIK